MLITTCLSVSWESTAIVMLLTETARAAHITDLITPITPVLSELLLVDRKNNSIQCEQ